MRQSSSSRFQVVACLAILFSSPCLGFQPPHSLLHSSSLYTRSGNSRLRMATQLEDDETMRHDIEEMKKEAMARFEKLTTQMEELKRIKRDQEANGGDDVIVKQKNSRSHPEIEVVAKTSLERAMEGDMTRQHRDLQRHERSVAKQAEKEAKATATTTPPAVTTTTPAKVAAAIPGTDTPVMKPYSLDLLDDTRWKIVFNIGREPGTWMAKEWGSSGDRLLFQVTVDFTDEPLYERDEFFQGSAGTKRLDVVEAFVIPRGVGSHSVGRRPLPCKPTGGYKVCRGQGPMGTDIVRLYVELTDTVNMLDHVSDVNCPPGRIYATCGYFVLHDSRETGAAKRKTPKEIAAEEHHAAVIQCESLQAQLDLDTRVFSVEKMKMMKDLFLAKQHLEETAKRYQQARQREPDKAQLRLSKKRDVGLSKDGGVCCKVHKGMALEYHILGRMEIGCVDDHHDDHHHHHHDTNELKH